MKFIKLSYALIITHKIKVYPNFKPSLFNQNALIQCYNDKCNQKISLSNRFKHINSNCDYRLLQCPAIKCTVAGASNKVFTSSIQCPFHSLVLRL